MKASAENCSTNGSTIKILVVDDSSLVRASLVAFLAEQPGLEVIGTAADGKEALVLIAQRSPDLVVMDLHMPVLDGLQTLRRIRESHRHTHVIIMTMSAGPEVKARCLASGADAFVSKQEFQRDLQGAIDRLFNRSASTSQLIPPCRPPEQN
jgi:DNA-binding NarL/FixJ family response regulator